MRPTNYAEAMDALCACERLSDARLDLLREHYGYENGIPGKVAPCENPAKYGVDCGKCRRCRSIHREGALVPADTRTKCERVGTHVRGGCELHA